MSSDVVATQSSAVYVSSHDYTSYQTWDLLTPVVSITSGNTKGFQNLRDLRPGDYFQLTPQSEKMFMVVDRVKSPKATNIVAISEIKDGVGFEILNVTLVSRRNRSK